MKCAVLCSGGLDSAVLLAWCAERFDAVVPLFVSGGLRWEAAERRAARAFLRRAALARVGPLEELRWGMRELYRGLWVLEGPVPGERAAWDSVYIPGRNVLLLSKAAAFCAARKVDAIAVGVLRGNPFPDSRPAFFRAFERAAGVGLGRELRVLAPFSRLTKAQVVLRGRGLPLELSLSCLDPRGALHCGRCTKCYERRLGFRRARVPDPTRYARGASR